MSDTTSGGGLFGMSPDFARNLLTFGASTMAAANARTPQGFLAYGGGPLGPIGAGLMGMQQQGMDLAKLRGQLGLQQAQTQHTQAETGLINAQMPYVQQTINDQMQINPGGYGPGAYGFSAGSASQGRPAGNIIPPEQREALARDAVKGTDVPAELLDAVVGHESGWDANAKGGKGEIGLGQVMPDTAKSPGYGVPGIDQDIEEHLFIGLAG